MSVVYVLKREDKPGISKVGRSDNSGKIRAGNYTDGNWKVHKEFEVPVFLAKPIEEKAHVLLKAQGHWLDPEITAGSAREVFTCGPKTAELKVKEAIKIVAIDAKEQSSLLADAFDFGFTAVDEPSTSVKPKNKTFGLRGLLILSLIFIVSFEAFWWFGPFLIASVVCGFVIWREK